MSKKWLVVCFVVLVCLLLARGVARGEEPESGETTIWVTVPVTPGDGRSYTIQPSGELPIYVRSDWSGGYKIQPPGELPTYVRPDWRGGYKIETPGELPTYVRPDWSTGTSGELPIPVPVVVIPD